MNALVLAESGGLCQSLSCVLVAVVVFTHSCEFPAMTLCEYYDYLKCCNNGGFIKPELCSALSIARDIFSTGLGLASVHTIHHARHISVEYTKTRVYLNPGFHPQRSERQSKQNKFLDVRSGDEVFFIRLRNVTIVG
jgi:hypothetical protein